MKQTEKNSSKVNSSVNNETLSVETIKAQLKSACVNMNAKETKDYIKGLAGYELKLTGEKPAQHYTIYFGEVRICNVEQVQGIKADGTARVCSSTAKVKSVREAASRLFDDIYNKLENDLTDDEKKQAEEAIEAATRNLCEVDYIFEQVNNRIAAKAKEAAKAKREEAAKERAQNKMNNKLKESSDNEKIAALAAVLDITFDEAKIIFEKKRAQKTA